MYCYGANDLIILQAGDVRFRNIRGEPIWIDVLYNGNYLESIVVQNKTSEYLWDTPAGYYTFIFHTLDRYLNTKQIEIENGSDIFVFMRPKGIEVYDKTKKKIPMQFEWQPSSS